MTLPVRNPLVPWAQVPVGANFEFDGQVWVKYARDSGATATSTRRRRRLFRSHDLVFHPPRLPNRGTTHLIRAEHLYETFHQFPPRDIGAFASDLRLPKRGELIGTAREVRYTSDKLNPETGEDEGFISYYHEHEAPFPKVYRPVAKGGKALPRKVSTPKSLVRLGAFDGYDVDKLSLLPTNGTEELYCSPGKRTVVLYVISDKSKVDLVVCGGRVKVRPEGIVY